MAKITENDLQPPWDRIYNALLNEDGGDDLPLEFKYGCIESIKQAGGVSDLSNHWTNYATYRAVLEALRIKPDLVNKNLELWLEEVKNDLAQHEQKRSSELCHD